MKEQPMKEQPMKVKYKGNWYEVSALCLEYPADDGSYIVHAEDVEELALPYIVTRRS
jgi:lipocalin